MAPQIEPAVATRSRRSNARRLFRVPMKPRWRALRRLRQGMGRFGGKEIQKVPDFVGRDSWIRTNDLQYPKLPRYQAALYPEYPLGNDVDTRLAPRPASRQRPFHRPLKSGCATRSPGSIPHFFAVPAITSSTPFAGPPDGMISVDSGSVFSAIRKIRPSARMKIMSSGI